MGIEAHFLHKCTIERPTGDTDAYGNASGDYYPVEAQRPCRLVEREQRIVADQYVEALPVTVYLLLIDADADVAERDRVTVFDLGAEGFDARTFTVKALRRRRGRALHHKSLALEAIS